MTDEEDVTAQLLRLTGAPQEPPVERAARVRQVVYDEWRTQRRRRVTRRAALVVALVGAAASIVLVVSTNRSRLVTTPSTATVLATGARLEGRPLVRRARGGTDEQPPLAVSMPIYLGDVIDTDRASRAAVQASNGSAVRIDQGSRVRFVVPDVLELMAGAVYVETSDRSRGFEVRTPFGTVHDVGTRFEVRLSDSSLRLRVRTGGVEVRHGSTVTAAAAGTEATLTTAGVATIRQSPPWGPDWTWTANLAPSFVIEGRTLRMCLEEIANEEGWTLRYAEPGIAEAAGRIILHGSVERLRAEEALDVALATSGLQYRLHGGELWVSRATDAR